MTSLYRSALSQYRNVDALGNVECADSHKLVQLLYDGLAESLITARGAIERGDVNAKTAAISKAAGIIDALHGSVDAQRGGSIAENLERLYEYMARKLLVANLHNDARVLQEVANVNDTLSGAWNTIPEEERRGAQAA